jgi:hypothetical protein
VIQELLDLRAAQVPLAQQVIQERQALLVIQERLALLVI